MQNFHASALNSLQMDEYLVVSAGLGCEGIGGSIHARSRTLAGARHATSLFMGCQSAKLHFAKRDATRRPPPCQHLKMPFYPSRFCLRFWASAAGRGLLWLHGLSNVVVQKVNLSDSPANNSSSTAAKPLTYVLVV